ncbi:fatty acid desaturase-domain-containing protein [Melampsora americana]|nr:fatty acid desaturase-domain-containing protein [Melampsora americana]
MESETVKTNPNSFDDYKCQKTSQTDRKLDTIGELVTFTRDQIKARIANGDVLVLHKAYVYKLNSWLKKHPGGELAILHFVGRDATNEIEAYHPDKVIDQMKCFIIGKVSLEDWNDTEGGQGWKPPDARSDSSADGGSPDSGYATADADSSNDDKETSSIEMSAEKESIRKRVKSTTSPISRQARTHHKNKIILGESLELTISEKLKALEPNLQKDQKTPVGGKYDVSPVRQQHLSRSYRRLHQQIRSAGLYDAPRFCYGYGPDLLRYTILFTLFFITSPFYPLLNAGLSSVMGTLPDEPTTPSTLQHLISAIFLGLWWHQTTFVAHDAGHSDITGDWTTDRLLGIFFGGFFNGLSIVTNHPEHDPDIQHLPFFAISSRFFSSLKSTYYNHTMKFDGFASKMVKHQHKLYYLVMMFARFNLFFNSYLFLANSKKQNKFRNLELCAIIGFWTYFGTLIYLLPTYPIRLMYILVSFAVTSPLHVQIVLSHFAQSTEDLGLNESFPHRQIRTTMDVSCPSYLDFIHGGLQRQVTHHLFPRMPRHNLRRATEEFVKPWCEMEGLDYDTYRFAEGNLRVLSVLKNVANQLKVLGLVAEAQARGEIH